MVHSPLPWKVTKWTSSTVVHDARNAVVCSLTNSRKDANAEFIVSTAHKAACFDELLAGCKAFVAWADECWGSWAINGDTTPETAREYNAAKAAIEKAEKLL